MKKTIIILFLFSGTLSAQEFLVEKLSGNVSVLQGTGEEWQKVEVGQKLSGNDVVATGENSFVQLSKDNSRFILNNNSALGLDNIKELTLNELLLALALEEIRNVPKQKGNGNSKNTAVYGTEMGEEEQTELFTNDFGIKKLNGARQLAESGYRESAVIVAKETYRNHPETKNLVDDRIYFVDILTELNLYEEALTELNDIKKSELSSDQEIIIGEKIKAINESLVTN